MAEKMTPSHIAPEELADYFEGLLPEEREGLIEEHFAECRECTAQAREYRRFSQTWERWTARAHGEAYRRPVMAQREAGASIATAIPQEQADLGAVLAGALRNVQERTENPEWRQRLEHWQRAGRATAVARLIMEAPVKALRIITEGLETLIPDTPGWQFALASGAVRVRGGRPRGGAASRTGGRARPRVTVSHEGGALVVRVENLPPGQLPLVVLLPTEAGSEPSVQELQRQQGGEYLTRFEEVEPGHYMVAFELMEEGDA